MTLDINRLTAEEQAKFKRIADMIQNQKPFEVATEDLGEQIAFIRRFGQDKLRFYSERFYVENPARTKAIYHKVRNQYVKNYRINQKKLENAITSFNQLIAKATVPV